MRETFGVGLSDLGDAVLWGEAQFLIEAAATDPSTVLGAELAGWSYPASTRDLIELIATIRDEKASKKLMPWALKIDAGQKADPVEVAAAQDELTAGIVFAD